MKTIGILLFLISAIASADTLHTSKDAKSLADKMVENFAKKEFKQGLALAKPYWPLPQVEIGGMANQISAQWPLIGQRFGESTGYEFVHEERIGNSFVRYYYLHKFQNHAIYCSRSISHLIVGWLAELRSKTVWRYCFKLCNKLLTIASCGTLLEKKINFTGNGSIATIACN